MKVYITKYAISKGIIEAESRPALCGGGYIKVDGYFDLFEPKDYYETKKEAIEKAEEMRIKRIESLKKQIAKLEKMKFE